MISKRCSLNRFPSTYINKSRRPSERWLVVLNFIFFLSRTPCSPNSSYRLMHLPVIPTLLELAKVFSSMSEPHLSDLCTNIIWRNRCLHLTYNCTTLQVVENISMDALHNHHWAFDHLENTISYRYHKTQRFQSTNWDKIPFELKYIPHFLQFSYYPIKYLDTNCGAPIRRVRGRHFAYIRRAMVPSRMYAKHQYNTIHGSECENTLYYTFQHKMVQVLSHHK